MNKVLCAALAASSFCLASTNECARLPTIIVYASRIDDARDSMPASVAVFDADEIQSSGARDLADLLRKKCCADVHSMNGNPLLTALSLRGFGDNGFGRVKVVLDGEELNNVDMNAPNLTRIPLGSIRRLELVRGPSPVLYGDGAVGGVVNVRTDPPDGERKTRLTARAGSQATFGASLDTRGGFDEDGVTYSAAYDYMQSDGFRSRSAYDIHSVNAGVRKDFENGSTAGFKINYQNAFYELPGSLSFDQWRHRRRAALNRDDWTRQWSCGVAADSIMKLAEDRWLYLDGSFSRQYRHARMAAWGTDTEYDSASFALSPRYVDETDVFDLGSKFTAGVDIRFDGYKDDPVAAAARRFSRGRFSVFAQEELHLTDELSIVAGARIERIENRWRRYAGIRRPKSHDTMLDAELGLVYRPLDGLKLFAKGTRFHRSAFCDELSWTRDGSFLKPETGESLDAGLEWEFLDEFSLDVNGYAMLTDDEIFFDPAIAPFGYNSNSPSRTRRIGFDAGFSWTRDKVAEASVRYGYVHADFASGRYHGNDVPYVPSSRVRAELGWWVFYDLEIKGGMSFVSRQRVSGDFANEARRLPSYTLFDIGAYYSPSWAEGWKASLVVDNLFDRDYCEYAGVGYCYPACGRSFLFTVSCEF